MDSNNPTLQQLPKETVLPCEVEWAIRSIMLYNGIE